MSVAQGSPLDQGRGGLYESDPFGNLAAALGTEDEGIQDLRSPQDVDELDNIISGDLVDDSRIAGCDQYLQQYKLACSAKGAQPSAALLQRFSDIPESLFANLGSLMPPNALLGGAVLRVPPNQDGAQTEALLNVLSNRTQGKVMLLDHLDMSGCTCISPRSLSDFVQGTASLGAWWRLRSLHLAGCALSLPHLTSLCGPEALPFLWPLQRLDISGNPEIGIDCSSGASRTAMAFGPPTVSFFFHLWRCAPLKYLNLTETGEISYKSKVILPCL